MCPLLVHSVTNELDEFSVVAAPYLCHHKLVVGGCENVLKILLSLVKSLFLCLENGLE